MRKYDHKEIEKKWQEKWDKDRSFKIDKDATKEKFYILDMFPYPSGEGLHMGHTESYTSTDIVYRYKKMQGFNVLHPQGFDSFGLPAENYAIKTGVHPRETTKKNTENYIRQMKSLGLGYDFEEALSTSSPEYYKWTQWIFLQFFKHDLVYKKTDTVNWCESCKTVLANEQVEEGMCERCKNQVIQKAIPGWFFRITHFADELIEGLRDLDWPEHTKKNQINWIGRSKGAEIDFTISGTDKTFTVFTTRPDTLFGATYCVLAPEHSLVESLKDSIANWDEVFAYIQNTAKKAERERLESKEKTGVEVKGVKALNPANGKEIPLFIADYVLASYGTGAIMAVPAHDERDFEFAKKFDLPIIPVISKKSVGAGALLETAKGTFLFQKRDNGAPTRPGQIALFGGGPEGNESLVECLKRELQEEIEYDLEMGTETFVANIESHNWPDKNLAIFYIRGVDKEKLVLHEGEEIVEMTLEEALKHDLVTEFTKEPIKSFQDIKVVYSGAGEMVNSGEFNGLSNEEAKEKITKFVRGKEVENYRLRDWSISRQRYWGAPIPVVYDPEGNAHPVPEEHLPWTLPEDVDFIPTGEAPLRKSKELKERTEKVFGNGWTPETDTMDTFVDSAWYYLRYPDPTNTQEFCSKKRLAWLPVDLYIGGAEHTYMHLLYARFFARAMKKVGLVSFDEPFLKLRHQGMVLDENGVKMSKSKGNVVNPDDMVDRFGADATRLYMMFAGPLEDDVMWSENGVVGTYRFLEKVWRTQEKVDQTISENTLTNLVHKTIQKVTNDLGELKFNTAISAMMILVNAIEKEMVIAKADYVSFLKLLAPFAPHITEELWGQLGNTVSIHEETWPVYDPEKIKDDTFTLTVQVNGKVRDTFEVAMDISEEDAKSTALAREKVQKWVEGKKPQKIIYVKGRLVNIVV